MPTAHDALPLLAVPEMQGTTEPLPNAPRQDPAVLDKEKDGAANWLLDALPDRRNARSANVRDEQKEGASRSAAARDQARSSSAGEVSDRFRADAAETAAGAERSTTDRKPAPSADPFARYMVDWLSPNDYALLHRTLGPGGVGSRETSNFNSSVPPMTESTLTSSINVLGESAPTNNSPGYLPNKPVENPYLEAMTAPPSASAPESAASSVPVPVKTQPIDPVQDFSAPKSRIPDFVKPASDEKYYKPLKRF